MNGARRDTRFLWPIGILALVLTVGTTVLFPDVALARGGGGNHGSSSSTSFSTGGGSGAGIFFLLPFLFGGGGGLLLLLLLFWFIGKRTGSGFQMPNLEMLNQNFQNREGSANDPMMGLAAIKEADPGFDEQRFKDRCQAAFFLLQKAWMDRNVDEGRAYMSSGLYQTWSMQVQQMAEAHKRNVLENLVVRGITIVKASHDDNYDNITARIDASCADYEVDDQSNKVVFGSKSERPFTEYWTFQRSAGAKTLATGGVTEQKCPNCGGPLQVNQNGSCHYCNAPVTSGKFDWVLSNITQADDWAG